MIERSSSAGRKIRPKKSWVTSNDMKGHTIWFFQKGTCKGNYKSCLRKHMNLFIERLVKPERRAAESIYQKFIKYI